LKNYPVLLAKPEALGAAAATTVVVGGLDVLLKKHHEKVGPIFHVLWHLAAAYSIHKFNQASLEITADELANLSSWASLGTAPSFLNESYQAVCDYLSSSMANGLKL
jgi:hypothetical protein